MYFELAFFGKPTYITKYVQYIEFASLKYISYVFNFTAFNKHALWLLCIKLRSDNCRFSFFSTTGDIYTVFSFKLRFEHLSFVYKCGTMSV